MMRRRFMNNSNSVPLSFEALEDGLSISLSNEILYCIDGGVWETLLKGENTEEVNKGSVISFRHAKSFFFDGSIGNFSINKKCNVYGACSSIIPKVFGEKFMSSNLFNNLFRNCDTIVDASKLELPTTLADFCFKNMFYGCSSLVNAPALPATTLAEDCYGYMFYGCSSLTTAPELPATTLAENCYEYMFFDCTKLNYIKMLAVDISAYWCLYYWVKGVSSTGTFVKNKDATWDTTPGALGYSGVPAGWTVVNDGEESCGNDFGIEFPLYLTFDYCDASPFYTYCERAADELGVKVYNCVKSIVDEYGEVEDFVTSVGEQVLDMLGIEIYVENSKVVAFHKEYNTYSLITNGEYHHSIVRDNGLIFYEF